MGMESIPVAFVYLFLALQALEIGLIVWAVLSKKNDTQTTDEILSKVRLLLLKQRLEEE